MQGLILSVILLPMVVGLILVLLPKNRLSTKEASAISVATLAATVLLAAILILQYHTGNRVMPGVALFTLVDKMDIYLWPDALGRFFLSFIPLVWLLCGIFSLEYVTHMDHQKRYWGFYLLTLGAVLGLCSAGNLVTMYAFFELMTVLSLPLVLHDQTHEAIMAGLKYLIYSMCGAYLALFGIFVFCHFGGTGAFDAGGMISASVWAEHEDMLRFSAFLMIIGFGVKAGMFPMQSWLPAAHPVAPAPASAVLSGIIVKGGALTIMRSIFYVVGADHLAGTWVQYTWIILAMITVFMGSMLAFREPVMKKRFAYSSVSQLSYILLGMALFNRVALVGAFLHIIFHAFMKPTLFLSAGAIIFKTGRTRVDELRGIGKEMPITLWCFTFAGLGLIGIPPISGFVSKWYLGVGALETGMPVISWLAPVVLLISALLTAGYILPITIQGFLPGDDYDYNSLEKNEPTWRMTIPLIVLAASSVLLGVAPSMLIQYFSGLAAVLIP